MTASDLQTLMYFAYKQNLNPERSKVCADVFFFFFKSPKRTDRLEAPPTLPRLALVTF